MIPFSLILLIALLIREDIIKIESIWSYFNKSGGQDVVSNYHQNKHKVLIHQYEGLEKNILDKESENKEINSLILNNKIIKGEQLPYDFKLWLVTCLLKVNDFQDAQFVIGSMWED